MFDATNYGKAETEPDMNYVEIDKGNARGKDNSILTDNLKSEMAFQKQ